MPLERLKHYSDAFDDLERAAVNVEVHFGDDVADALREPLRAYEKIAIATACRMGRVGLSAQVKLSPTLVRRWETVVRSSEYCDVGAEDADQICAKISEAKRTIEDALRSYLEPPTFGEFLALRRLRVLVARYIGRLVRRHHQSAYGKIAVYAQVRMPEGEWCGSACAVESKGRKLRA